MDEQQNKQDNKKPIGLLKEREHSHIEGRSGERAKLEGEEIPSNGATAKRNHYQLGRRLFHLSSGFILATFYALFLTHKQIVYIVGTLACLMYLFEQIRIAYPELSEKLVWANRLLLRAEEQLKESAAIPYIMALLLTILTFPKVVALIAIYTLAIGDPLSALVGIRYGKHRIVPGKSLEGTGAFFLSAMFCTYGILGLYLRSFGWEIFGISVLIGFISSIFETLPVRIDDNLTIPLFTAFTAWACLGALGVPL